MKLNQAVIEVRDLRKSFKNTEVLKGVDIDVQQGEIFALLGVNGAGKTTLVNILSTLLKADSGSMRVCGFDVALQPDKVRECISLTGQFAAVDGVLSGRENLTLIAKLRGINNHAQLVDSLLERFGLSQVAHLRASTYSGGMLRKLDIAMSLIGDPAVIFLDEPTTGLDPKARLEVWETIKALSRRGTTILLTTQYLEEAEQLAHRVSILHDGKIIVHGTLEQLKELLPPAKVEYVEKKPTLEEVFLTMTGSKEESPK